MKPEAFEQFLSECLGLVVHLTDGGLGALAHPAAAGGRGFGQLLQHAVLLLLFLQQEENRGQHMLRKLVCHLQSWADANVFASSRPQRKSILTTETRRRATAENEVIAKDATGHRREISRHWRQ